MSARLRIRPGGGVETIVLSIFALSVTLVLYGGFVALRGHDPLAVYRTLWIGAFGSWFSLQYTLTQAAPLMLTGLCTALPARAGMLVIGGEGALVLGGVAAVIAGVVVADSPAWFAIPAICAAGALAGGVWIGAAGALRHLRGVNETISTLLLNYIAIALMNHLVSGPIRDFEQVLKPSSWSIRPEHMLAEIPNTSIHWGLAFGIAACALAWLLMRRSTFGFAAEVLGGNERAARMVGLPVGRITIAVCMLGGAAAGLAGSLEVVAVHGFASASLVAGYGYAGILASFVARHNPLGVIVVAVLLGGISASGGLLQRRFDLPDAATTVLLGTLFLVVLATSTLHGRVGALATRKT